MWALLPQFLHHAHLADGFLLRHVPHAAGVEQDHIGLRLGGDKVMTARDERAGDVFRIALVHLAAVGFDVNAWHDWNTPP